MLKEWMNRKKSKVMAEMPGTGEKLQVIATISYKGDLYGIFSKEIAEPEESMLKVFSIYIENGQIVWKEAKEIDLEDNSELTQVVAYALTDEALEEKVCPHYEVVRSEKYPGYYVHDRILYTQWELNFRERHTDKKSWMEGLKTGIYLPCAITGLIWNIRGWLLDTSYAWKEKQIMWIIILLLVFIGCAFLFVFSVRNEFERMTTEEKFNITLYFILTYLTVSGYLSTCVNPKSEVDLIAMGLYFVALLISLYDCFLYDTVIKLKLPVWMTEEMEVISLDEDEYETVEYEE